MNALEKLEKSIEPFGEKSSLQKDTISQFSENLRSLHSYKIFGNNLLAVPAELIIEGDEEEFEKPFRFLSDEDELKTFEDEFREEIPDEFIQIGSLYGATEIVLLNKHRNTIHIFHVQDICDLDWLQYKLQEEICTFDVFIENLRPQTVSCLINLSNYTQYEMFEIRNETDLFDGTDLRSFSNREEAWTEYYKLVDNAIKDKFEFHYAPQKVLDRFSN
ncbi:hypothetical protein [Flavobacterium notoginsengisoli]|uniref:hypothetical protein n=1 Tax=Flavobacterium notoginsengisoli TaxID=1478199 RepID=UPI00362C7D07